MTPRARSADATAGAASLNEQTGQGFAILHTAKGRARCGLDAINAKTEFVHIDGPPNLWAFEELLARAPNLKTIQVIPSAYPRVRGGLALCIARKVDVVRGHARPELAWQEHRIVSPQYAKQRKFLLNLSGVQRELFNELLSFGFEEAMIVRRYYCLGDEAFVPQRLIAAEYGYGESANSSVSALMLGVLHYLDDSLPVGECSVRRAFSMRATVERLRPYVKSAETRMRLIADIGVAKLADRFPLARASTFKRLLVAFRSGQMAELARERPRLHEALVLRFGLMELDRGVYRKLEDVGVLMGGISRERVRQLEEAGLGALGITDADD